MAMKCIKCKKRSQINKQLRNSGAQKFILKNFIVCKN